MMFRITKTFTVDQICDLYLNQLLKLEKEKKQPEFLNKILDNKRVYYSQEAINEVIEKLTKNGFIQKGGRMSLYSYRKREPLNKRGKSSPMSKILDNNSWKDLFKNLEGAVELYELTNKGRNFLVNHQVFDEDGKKIRKEKIDKWVDRLFGFGAGIVATLLVTWLTNKIF